MTFDEIKDKVRQGCYTVVVKYPVEDLKRIDLERYNREKWKFCEEIVNKSISLEDDLQEVVRGVFGWQIGVYPWLVAMNSFYDGAPDEFWSYNGGVLIIVEKAERIIYNFKLLKGILDEKRLVVND